MPPPLAGVPASCGAADPSPATTSGGASAAARGLPQWMVDEAATALTPPTVKSAAAAAAAATTQRSDASPLDSCGTVGHADSSAVSIATPTKALYFPDLTTLDVASDPLSDLADDELSERRHIASQCLSRQQVVYSLILSAPSLAQIKLFVPEQLWDHPFARLALHVSILRGSEEVVAWVVGSAFRNYHSMDVPDLYAPPRLLAELGIPCVSSAASFLELATLLLATEADPETRRRRERIFLLVRTAPGMCCTQRDCDFLAAAAAQPGPSSDLLSFWAANAAGVACRTHGCLKPPRSSLTPVAPPATVWAPAAHRFFPLLFQQRVASWARVAGRVVAEPVAWRDTVTRVASFLDHTANNGRSGDRRFPVRVTVADQVHGNVELFDGSAGTLKKSARFCPKGTVLAAGMRVTATLPDPRAGATVASGHIVGVLNDVLYWRTAGAFGCEALPPACRLDPLPRAAQDTLATSRFGSDGWFCGVCVIINSVHTTRCRRCQNTHQSALALEFQKSRQGGMDASQTQHRGLGSRSSSRHGSAPSPGHFQQRLIHPVVSLNLSAPRPQREQFETADQCLAMYGVRSGEMVRTATATGVVLGIGKDDSLYWVVAGAPGMRPLQTHTHTHTHTQGLREWQRALRTC